MAEVWRFIRAYKKKSLTGGCFTADDGSLTGARSKIADKLCPPSCLFPPTQSLREMEILDRRSDGVYPWMDNPFEISELEAAPPMGTLPPA